MYSMQMSEARRRVGSSAFLPAAIGRRAGRGAGLGVGAGAGWRPMSERHDGKGAGLAANGRR